MKTTVRSANRCKIVLAILLTVITAQSVVTAYPIKVKDATGTQVVIKSKPVRIVSLAPSVTEILYALGLENRIVGVTTYCRYPTQATKKPKVGDMRTSAESVIALNPDLIIGHAFVNSSVITQLRRLGKTVYAMDPKSISQVIQDIRILGAITSQTKNAELVVSKLTSSFAAVKAERAKHKSRRVLMVIQASPLWVAGPKTFVDEMLRSANSKNIAYDARMGFVPFSNELAITRNPEVIITGSKGDSDFFLRSAAWKNTSAVKNKHVYVILPDLLVRPGPRLADGLRELSKRL